MTGFVPGDGEAGFTSVSFMLMMLVMVVAVGGISVDLWHVVAEHRDVAGVVDGAALAGAAAVDRDGLRADPTMVRLQPEEATTRACDYLRSYGRVSLCPGPEADVVVGPDTVTVTVRRSVGLTLLQILSGLDPGADTSPIEVGATATARVASR